ncbi:MAG: DUF4954 family protein [Prevotella sp.]|jgi:carbonic anhydrase/acetyltransferase-like protein (isoleucine patch superfamily)|nr:DUF4954 family protein [Prevotella sp.]
MKETYRDLTNDEILQLNSNNCSCENWNMVKVKEGFNPSFVRDSRFSGHVQLGVFGGYFELEGGMKKHSGIFRATIHNCKIGDDVLIENINGYIANYRIGSNTYIEDCNTLVVDGETSFGNGVKVAVLDETGGRDVIIYDKLSSHFAYIYSLYKYRPGLIAKMEQLALDYAEEVSSSIGYIGRNTCIKNVGYIKNVKIGDNCHIEEAAKLENGSINSNFDAPVYIGSEVIAQDFIICSDSEIDEGVVLTRCFIGQACRLGHRFSAADSLIFSNCLMENGEVCALFAGPYTVTHHKSSLLIGAMCSFYNAGSGSNQSNHMYKLGPFHYGISDRGSKSASSSYILWPGYIGAYTIVMGRHYSHFDTSHLPFSYLVEKDGASCLAPGINLARVGTMRDARKWPERDKRTDPEHLDFINFALMNPFIGGKVIAGIDTLQFLQAKQGRNAERYKYNGCFISQAALQRGIKLYSLAIDRYIGDIFIKQLSGNSPVSEKNEAGSGFWLDVGGMFVPQRELEKVLTQIEAGEMTDVDSLHAAFGELHNNYEQFEWKWALEVLNGFYSVKDRELNNILTRWKDASIELDEMICEDAKKEFGEKLTVVFGIDGMPEDKQADVEIVRGRYEDHPLVKELRERIGHYQHTYEEIMKLL